MLAKIEEAPDNLFTTPNLKNHERGEMLFLRAYVYSQLWNVFGMAPVITDRIQTTDKITPPSSEGTQLLDQAITDLQQAAALLPASWNAANLGRATQHSANALLGKALVFRASSTKNNADYTAAIQAFDKIMEWVRQERFVELAAEEGHRWFDLRRWHLGGQINLTNWNFNSLRTDFSFNANTHVNFPIPLNEMNLNPNITQNPGY